MNVYVQQTISIHQLKIGSLTNSSVLQIGTTGKVQPLATLSNTGQFTQPAPESKMNIQGGPLVPLQSPV
ncbi:MULTISPECIES: spore germination protein GerPB [Anoxybacillus]|uniref:Spore germination protein GerPB n=1 Tax=Anoxybacillus flavithermus TaxID=33934 RepID=A0A178TEB4_9BACL|nr:spore germination protein GerPB [Anoxybacillus flavithermus]ASA96642.1 spore gernimation protein [Anoxybacillus flavithermus]ELK21148.1 spore germination protein PB [Anoxybacillus flavithermus TNO-09.006]MBE2905685.1 spore gernimation protein [Anoxybacillus flavithermus]MBE2907289.1 spore gernimation protein [Anoxybacillus flavithermus]MBE2909827.1 spore gernimation protein [Anoxybacillus flavithermus]